MTSGTEVPIEWVSNPGAAKTESLAAKELFPDGVFAKSRSFHQQVPGYEESPLSGLPRLAAMISVGGIWVKDESVRLSLNSFKVLGGSFAIYRFIQRQLGLVDGEITFD